jgi:nucleoside-diphosphate-sugar epimerase
VNASPAPKRIAVVGGGGFIGRHLVARLADRGATVQVVGLSGPGSRGNVDWTPCDVRDVAGLRGAFEGMDLVYNLAAAHGLNTHASEVYHQVNVEGARSVCAAASVCGVRQLIFTSTADVYGEGPLFDESMPTRPLADYGRTKVEAEAVYRSWAGESAGRSLVVVRPTVVFGPGGEGAADRFIRHVAGPDFTHYGEAGNRRSMAYVDNLAEFLAFVADHMHGIRTFNYADVPDLTVAEIVSIVRSAVGLAPAPQRSLAGAYATTLGASLKARLVGGPRRPAPAVRGMIRQLSLKRRLDASLAHATGFIPPVALREALAITARADVRWVAFLSRARA